MTIVVEDGSGRSDAESYVSVSEADAYLAARNRTDWATQPIPQREAALRIATEYLDRTYGLRWLGYRLSDAQALTWPRRQVKPNGYLGYLPSTAIPMAVRNASIELAFASLSIDLSPDLMNQSTSGGAVKREKIGPIEIEYTEGVVASTGNSFVTINGMLAPLLASGMNSIPVVRC